VDKPRIFLSTGEPSNEGMTHLFLFRSYLFLSSHASSSLRLHVLHFFIFIFLAVESPLLRASSYPVEVPRRKNSQVFQHKHPPSFPASFLNQRPCFLPCAAMFSLFHGSATVPFYAPPWPERYGSLKKMSFRSPPFYSSWRIPCNWEDF